MPGRPGRGGRQRPGICKQVEQAIQGIRRRAGRAGAFQGFELDFRFFAEAEEAAARAEAAAKARAKPSQP